MDDATKLLMHLLFYQNDEDDVISKEQEFYDAKDEQDREKNLLIKIKKKKKEGKINTNDIGMKNCVWKKTNNANRIEKNM